MVLSNLTLLILFSFFYVLGILYMYFSKSRLNTGENRIYAAMLITNLVGLLLQLSCDFVSFSYDIFPQFISDFILRFYLIYFIIWATLMFLYLVELAFKNKNSATLFISVVTLIFIVAVMVLPYDLYRDITNRVYYTHGSAVMATFVFSAIVSTSILVILILKRKSISRKKALPIYGFLFLGLIFSIVQLLKPELVITAAMESLICCLMYFTIENPDAKMIEELNRNKSIIEKSSQGISNFMFTITTESRKYINDITNFTNEALEVNKNDIYRQSLRKILERSKVAEAKVNYLIDISAIDVKNIKITNQQYNISKIFDEIKLQNQNKINNNVNFIINISPNLPEKLYGDKIRIKQVLSSLIANAINHTTEGFISLEVNTIIKYDACRLIISVEDSGSGLSLEKVNDILSFNENISDLELSQIDTLDMDLKMIKKVIKMLGGSLLLTSDENKGTKVTIILDQIIADHGNTELEEKLTNYNQLLGIQKVLIVDDDLKELNDIENYFDELGIETVGTMYGGDAVDKIRTGQKFDLIILDDEMKPTNAINVFEKLKEYEEIDAKVIIMLKDKKISMSKHYMKEGFADYIDKSKLDVEIKRIAKEYLK